MIPNDMASPGRRRPGWSIRSRYDTCNHVRRVTTAQGFPPRRDGAALGRPKKKGCQDWFRSLAALGWPPSRRSERKAFLEGGTTVMSTLAVVEEILRETAVPMSVREIVERAGQRLPSKSKTPDTVVARDLSMDIKRNGEMSLFVRTSPGRYTLRTLAGAEATPPMRQSTPSMSTLAQ